jgi:hypothetical protein
MSRTPEIAVGITLIFTDFHVEPLLNYHTISFNNNTCIIKNKCNNMNYWGHCVVQSGKRIREIAFKI